jgi:hypothetical protein
MKSFVQPTLERIACYTGNAPAVAPQSHVMPRRLTALIVAAVVVLLSAYIGVREATQPEPSFAEPRAGALNLPEEVSQ